MAPGTRLVVSAVPDNGCEDPFEFGDGRGLRDVAGRGVRWDRVDGLEALRAKAYAASATDAFLTSRDGLLWFSPLGLAGRGPWP